MRTVAFWKMEGIGNDFIVMHGYEDLVDTIIEQATKLCDRRKGIGADGIIFILHSTTPNCLLRMRIINADGSEPEMCGNGIRCFARYALTQGIVSQESFFVETLAGPIGVSVSRDFVRVNMGPPVLEASKIPTTESGKRIISQKLHAGERVFSITAVSMGNPHCVIYANDLTDDLVLGMGPIIEKNPFFPNKTNVEFILPINDGEIAMRVWERGCGETQACGTGACGAVVAGILNGVHGNAVTVHLPGGDLFIEWSGDEKDPVFKTGPARKVFQGVIDVY